MQEHWNTIKISDIKEISDGCGGSYSVNGETHEMFSIKMKDGTHYKLHYFSKDGTRYGEEARIEIKKLFNKYNKIPDIYILENEAHSYINGKMIKFGYRVIDNLGQYIRFTQKEIDELEKQFKIKDEGWRHMASICMLEIKDNKIIFPKKVPERYLEQLEYMGYNISMLEYELE